MKTSLFARGILLLMALCLLNRALAQTDSLILKTLPEQEEFEQSIEDLLQNIDSEDQVDFSYLSDQLEIYLEKPLNLNTASREELIFLPGWDDILISRLQKHIQVYGKLASVYELQTIQGFSTFKIRQFLPYVSVRETGVKNTDPNNAHSKGPSVSEIKRNLKFEFTQRMVWTLEEQKGYMAADTSFRPIFDKHGVEMGTDTSLSSRYAGSPYRIYSRFQARYSPYISVALVGEKDAGEAFTWDNNQKIRGYDFLSGHIAIQNYGRLKQLVLGDYTMQFGQGLVLSRGLGFGKGAQVIQRVKMPGKGISSYRSVNENQFMRGIAGTYAIGKLYLSGFYSDQYLDANVQIRDTLSDEALLASSLQTSGYHRTPSELLNRNSVREKIIGGRLAYRSENLRLGLTHYFQNFGSEINPIYNPYNLFAFRGKHNHVSGLDLDWVYKNVNFFAELAASRSGGMGAVAGLMAAISPTVDFSLLGRKFDKDFHSSKAYAFAERPTAVQNETGLYLGLRMLLAPKWTLNTYVDQFYFPTSKFRAYFPSHGWEVMSQLEFKPSRSTLVYARFKTDHQEQNVDRDEAFSQVNYLVPFRRDQFRLHFQSKVHRDITYKSRIEFSRVYEASSFRGKGMMIYQDLVWKFGYNWRLSTRYALFDIPLSDARIYAYENDVLGFFSIPAFRGSGSRYYIMLNSKLGRSLECWIRLAQTRLTDVQQIGSGLESIEGNTKSELKLQIRWKF